MKHSLSVISTIVPQLGHCRVWGLPAGAGAGAAAGGGGGTVGGGGAGRPGAGGAAGLAGGIVATCPAGTASGISSGFFRRRLMTRKMIAPRIARMRIRRSHQYWSRKPVGVFSVIVAVVYFVS